MATIEHSDLVERLRVELGSTSGEAENFIECFMTVLDDLNSPFTLIDMVHVDAHGVGTQFDPTRDDTREWSARRNAEKRQLTEQSCPGCAQIADVRELRETLRRRDEIELEERFDKAGAKCLELLERLNG